jgi:hypothetical protein
MTDSEFSESISTVHAEALAAERAADVMYQLAVGLENDVADIGPLLHRVHGLHTASTWMGDAATRSRDRLDLASRTSAEITRTLLELASDLRAQAGARQRHADEAWRAHTMLSARRREFDRQSVGS